MAFRINHVYYILSCDIHSNCHIPTLHGCMRTTHTHTLSWDSNSPSSQPDSNSSRIHCRSRRRRLRPPIVYHDHLMIQPIQFTQTHPSCTCLLHMACGLCLHASLLAAYMYGHTQLSIVHAQISDAAYPFIALHICT